LVDIDPADKEAIVVSRQNLLLCGTPPVIEAVLSALGPHFRQPIHRWRCDSQEAPPYLTGGTLIVERLTDCRHARQQSLLEWCDQTGGQVQVVSAADRPLFDLVERGVFLAPLYYRLNTVYLNLTNVAN
jgi:hypothetical protein